MKNKILPILLFVSISICGMAQTAPPPPPPPPPPAAHDTARSNASSSHGTLTFAEVMPTFEGGFQRYLAENIKYPTYEKEHGKQGTVYISFIIEKDGSVTNVREAKGVPGAPGLTKEAIRVISEMPNWSPGMMDGKPIRIEMTQPIRFVLETGKKKKRH